MCIPRQVFKNDFRTAKWSLGVHDPILADCCIEPAIEVLWIGQVL